MRSKRSFPMAMLALVLLLGLADGAAAQAEEPSAGPTIAGVGNLIGEAVDKAWDTKAAEDIEAVYDPEVVMILDGETLAVDRDELANVIAQARGIGNSYRHIGPVAEYWASDGDLYVAALVEVSGVAHQDGVPVVGFYRVRDGRVIRHVFMDAEHY